MESIYLREAREDDLPSILEIYNEALVTSTATFERDPQTIENRRGWFWEHGSEYPLIVAESERKVIGYCSISGFERNSGYSKTVELSVYVHKEFRRRGIGRTLMKEIIHRSKALGYHAILSSISEENESSKRLHEQLGFEFVGRLKEVGWKFSKWQDTSYYELLL